MATTSQGTQAHGGPAEGHGGGAFPPFQGDTFAAQLLWLAIAFGALYWLLSKVALPRVASILEERRDRIEADLDTAARLKSETEAAIAAYEKALADARASAQSLAADTRDKLAAEAEENRKGLEADLAAKLAAAEKTIGATKAAAMANVQAIATEAAGAIVERLVGVAPPADHLAKAVADATQGRRG